MARRALTDQALSGRILVVDDHPAMANVVSEALTDAGWECVVNDSGAAAIAALREHAFDLVITDLRMAEVDGMDVLAAMRDLDADVPVIIMTAFGGIDSAIEAMRRGAHHYLTKPVRLEELRLHVERAIAERRLRREHRALASAARTGLDALIGDSPAMRALTSLVARVAPSPAPVLVRGESGTGKELVARALHAAGPRRDGPFVAVNCTALPEALLESELFGHVRGAFTGATATRAGLFVEASGGTLFLDEIGDMAPSLQAKLLRVVQLGEVRAVGSDDGRAIDVRLVSATHRDLEARVAAGEFREDLYYRLDVVPIRIPPLRDRAEDVPALANHFFAQSCARNPHSPVRRMAPELISALAREPWPGNVRELENHIERMVVMATGPRLGVEAMDRARRPTDRPDDRVRTLREVQDDYIAEILARVGGNKTRAAELLGVDPSTLHRRTRRD
jgi:two-component system response regulator HydG